MMQKMHYFAVCTNRQSEKGMLNKLDTVFDETHFFKCLKKLALPTSFVTFINPVNTHSLNNNLQLVSILLHKKRCTV
jgi:hypothetical protein